MCSISTVKKSIQLEIQIRIRVPTPLHKRVYFNRYPRYTFQASLHLSFPFRFICPLKMLTGTHLAQLPRKSAGLAVPGGSLCVQESQPLNPSTSGCWLPARYERRLPLPRRDLGYWLNSSAINSIMASSENSQKPSRNWKQRFPKQSMPFFWMATVEKVVGRLLPMVHAMARVHIPNAVPPLCSSVDMNLDWKWTTPIKPGRYIHIISL